MEPEGSLPHSQASATCPYPETDKSSPCPSQSHFLNIHLNIILPPAPGSSKWSLSFRLTHQNPVQAPPHPIRATCPAHLILHFITQTILGKQYKSLSSSICSFLHYPVTSSLLAKNYRDQFNVLTEEMLINYYTTVLRSYQVRAEETKWITEERFGGTMDGQV